MLTPTPAPLMTEPSSGMPFTARPRKPTMDAAIKAAGLIIVTKEGRALFLLRSDHEEGDHVGEWAFPAGKIEDGEEPEETVIREVREETQWIPENKISELSKHTSDEDVDFTCFEVNAGNEFIPTLNEEHIGWCWAPLDKPPQPLHPGCQTILDMALGAGLAEDLIVEDKEEYKTVQVGNELHWLRRTKQGWVLVKKAPVSGSNILHHENLGELFGLEFAS